MTHPQFVGEFSKDLARGAIISVNEKQIRVRKLPL